MMLESVWSEPRSGVTEEEAGAAVNDHQLAGTGPNVPSRLCTGFGGARQLSVVPRVERNQVNRNDQRVPVYRDQTVPVWQGGGECKRASRAGLVVHGRRFGGGGGRAEQEEHILGENCWRCGGGGGGGGSGSRMDEYVDGSRGDCMKRDDHGSGARANASKGVDNSQCSS